MFHPQTAHVTLMRFWWYFPLFVFLPLLGHVIFPSLPSPGCLIFLGCTQGLLSVSVFLSSFPWCFFFMSLLLFKPVLLCQSRFRHTFGPSLFYFFSFLVLSDLIKLSVSMCFSFFCQFFCLLSLCLQMWCIQVSKKWCLGALVWPLVHLQLEKIFRINKTLIIKMKGSGACVKPIYYLSAFLICSVPEMFLFPAGCVA